MRRLFIVTLMALASCGGGIKDAPLTERTMERVRDSEDLTETDRTLLAGYMARTAWEKMQKDRDTTPEFFDEDVTVGEAIESQRRWAAQDSARRAGERQKEEEARQRREADLVRARAAATVTVTGKRSVPEDPQAGRFTRQSVITVTVANTGDRPIAGLKGRLVVRDLFDDEVIALEFKHDDALAPGASTSGERFYDINRYMDEQTRLYGMGMEKLRFTWEPQTIIFADGSKLEVAEPPAVDRLSDLLRLP